MTFNYTCKLLAAMAFLLCFPANALAAGVDSIAPGPYGGMESAYQNLNPDISVIVDTFYYNDDSDEAIAHVFEEIEGFGQPHGHAHEDGHGHSHLEEGFNLRHLEIYFSGEVDPYFEGWAIAAISEEGAEIEEAVIRTTFLPYGLQVKGGKFFSDFGRINPIHAHAWDFVDQPLIYKLTLGEHGLNEKGVQVSWLAPTPFYWLSGIEAFQGENEKLFNHIGEEPLPEAEGPRAWVGWMKFGPRLADGHGLQIGVSGGTGTHQEGHEAEEGEVGTHFLDGDSHFWGADFVYKYDATPAYGKGDWVFHGEYFYRKKDLDLIFHETAPALVGNSRVDKQDGYYVQAVYGFMPRWRIGARWEEVGLTNESRTPDGNEQDFDASWRASAMVDFSPSEFSRLRLQASNGEYKVDGDAENIWSVFFQCVISLGTHGAHAF